jgi:hypothetical protein
VSGGLECIAADIPDDLAAVDALLSRYFRWATASSRGGRLHTAERQYVAVAERSARYALENRREMAYGLATKEPVMPSVEAIEVQRALARVPELERLVLVALYLPHRIPSAARLAQMHVPPRLSRVRHLAGLRMLRNLLKAAQR